MKKEKNNKIQETGVITIDDLFKACANGDLTVVKKWAEKGGDFNVVYTNYDTPLRAACRENKGEIVKFLLGKGANIDDSSKIGESPVMICIINDSFQSLDTLLKSKPNLDAVNHYGSTAFMMALHWDMFSVALRLLNQGAKAFPLHDKMNINQPLFNLIEKAQWNTATSDEVRQTIKNLYWAIIKQERAKVDKNQFVLLLEKIITHVQYKNSEPNFIVEEAKIELEKVKIERAIEENTTKNSNNKKSIKRINKV